MKIFLRILLVSVLGCLAYCGYDYVYVEYAYPENPQPNWFDWMKMILPPIFWILLYAGFFWACAISFKTRPWIIFLSRVFFAAIALVVWMFAAILFIIMPFHFAIGGSL